MRRIRLLSLLAVLAGLVLFVAPAKDGRPLLDFAAVKARFAGSAPGAPESGGVYKWQDADGTWHYSNVRPEGRGGVEKVKETITWAKGSGGGAPAADAPRGGEPRSAAELLAESKRLGEKSEARETELQKALREAQ